MVAGGAQVGPKTQTVPVVRLPSAYEFAQGGAQVEVVVKAFFDCTRSATRYRRRANDQGQTVRRLIGGVVVAPDVEFAVVLAVVGADDDYRLFKNALSL